LLSIGAAASEAQRQRKAVCGWGAPEVGEDWEEWAMGGWHLLKLKRQPGPLLLGMYRPKWVLWTWLQLWSFVISNRELIGERKAIVEDWAPEPGLRPFLRMPHWVGQSPSHPIELFRELPQP
jgi:hypothetical protein